MNKFYQIDFSLYNPKYFQQKLMKTISNGKSMVHVVTIYLSIHFLLFNLDIQFHFLSFSEIKKIDSINYS